MKNQNIIITILLIIIVGGGAFAGGMKFGERRRTGTIRQFYNERETRGRMGQLPGNRGGLRPVNGEIISSDDKSITVKSADGGSKIVLISEKTAINKASAAGKDDLKIGEKVAIFGQENSDGSVTADNVQINPIFAGLAN